MLHRPPREEVRDLFSLTSFLFRVVNQGDHHTTRPPSSFPSRGTIVSLTPYKKPLVREAIPSPFLAPAQSFEQTDAARDAAPADRVAEPPFADRQARPVLRQMKVDVLRQTETLVKIQSHACHVLLVEFAREIPLPLHRLYHRNSGESDRDVSQTEESSAIRSTPDC